MAIEVSRDIASGQLHVLFIITDDRDGNTDDTTVSVVGSFNDWRPGANAFTRQEDGSLTTSVKLNSDDDIHFRYLRTGGIWFDDADADEITAFGSVIHNPSRRLASKSEPADEFPLDNG